MKKFLIGTLLLLSLFPRNSLADNLSSATCPGTGCQTQNVGNSGLVGVQITGTWAGTITFQGSIDNSTYVSLLAVPSTTSTPVTTTTGNGSWTINAAGYSTVRIRFTSYSSGTAVVSIRNAQYTVKLGGGGGGGGGVTEVATSSPLSGGPITTTGTIECSTCAVTSGNLGQFAATTSAQLAGVISNETGTGVLVFNTSPTFITPTLGAASATTLDTGQGANELFDMDQNVLTTSDVTFNLVSFLIGDGLSFAGAVSPTTIVGGTIEDDSGLIIDNAVDEYVRISLPQYTEFISPQGFVILINADYSGNSITFFADSSGLSVSSNLGVFGNVLEPFDFLTSGMPAESQILELNDTPFVFVTETGAGTGDSDQGRAFTIYSEAATALTPVSGASIVLSGWFWSGAASVQKAIELENKVRTTGNPELWLEQVDGGGGHPFMRMFWDQSVTGIIATHDQNTYALSFRAYDVNDTQYRSFAVLTAGNTPTLVISPPSGGTVEVQATTYKSSDGTTGATVTTCTGFKNGLCISGS